MSSLATAIERLPEHRFADPEIGRRLRHAQEIASASVLLALGAGDES